MNERALNYTGSNAEMKLGNEGNLTGWEAGGETGTPFVSRTGGNFFQKLANIRGERRTPLFPLKEVPQSL
jgi:hypothetical protein